MGGLHVHDQELFLVRMPLRDYEWIIVDEGNTSELS
jgi:hypothetical protein